jgi:DNA-binding helix-hairpin-helix protein with protein kinase domain
VFGDVNPNNVLVADDATVRLIDCDSFQITTPSERFLCEVGVANFSPPELQDTDSFRGLVRTVHHDNFGLALLVFHLLFGGRHPYSGVPQRPEVGERMESDIKAFRFAYSRAGLQRGFLPPPGSIPLSLLPDPVAMLFEYAFTEPGAAGGRPSANDWVLALDRVRRALRTCHVSRMHAYPGHLSRCPWCELEKKGIIYFVGLMAPAVGTRAGLSVEQLWRVIEGIPVPTPVPIPSVRGMRVVPRPLPPEIPERWINTVLKVLVVICSLMLMGVFPAAFLFILIGAVVAWDKAEEIGEAQRATERALRKKTLDQAWEEYEALLARFNSEASRQGFLEIRRALTALHEEWRQLPAAEAAAIDELKRTAEARQRHDYLSRCFLDTANIPKVGLSKKAALRSFGIETAADVSWGSVHRVQGFGDVLTRAVVDWRNACERRFVFDPRQAVTDADRNAIRARIGARRATIQSELSSGATRLQNYVGSARQQAQKLEPLLHEAARKLAHARADFSLLDVSKP